MARAIVRLYCEQHADVEVDAEPGTSDEQLQRLALKALDDSGGAEWVTDAGWVENVTWPAD